MDKKLTENYLMLTEDILLKIKNVITETLKLDLEIRGRHSSAH